MALKRCADGRLARRNPSGLKRCGCCDYCNDPIMEFGYVEVRKKIICPAPFFGYFCDDSGLVPCDPLTGSPCDPTSDCHETSGCSIGTISMSRDLGTFQFTNTGGSGGITFNFGTSTQFCELELPCPQPEEGSSIVFGSSVDITDAEDATKHIILNELAVTNMVAEGGGLNLLNGYDSDVPDGGGGVALALPYTDLDNPHNVGLWVPGKKYNVVIHGGFAARNPAGGVSTVPVFSSTNNGLEIICRAEGCCIALDGLSEVDGT